MIKREKKVKRQKTLGQLKKEADEWYSRKLRLEASDDSGEVRCYTCSTRKPWKAMQCGHYVSRTYSALRYYRKNTKPQCSGCNMFNQGRLDVFALNLIQEYGEGILEELQSMKQGKALDRWELETLIEECKQAVKEGT